MIRITRNRILGIVGGVVLLWLVLGFGPMLLLDEWPKGGALGDMFGLVNALFSGLAFAGVILAILLQGRELELQRDELKLTRDELSGQREQLERQNETLAKQAFENTFFNLLRVLSGIVDTFVIRTARGEVARSGRGCFDEYYSKLMIVLKKEASSGGGAELVRAYDGFYQKHQADLGHYFRTLYNLIKLVDRSDIDDKRTYTNLVRAQLSNYELVVLFYNCLGTHGSVKFKPLIEKYGLLKNMPKSRLRASQDSALYELSAFGAS